MPLAFDYWVRKLQKPGDAGLIQSSFLVDVAGRQGLERETRVTSATWLKVLLVDDDKLRGVAARSVV